MMRRNICAVIRRLGPIQARVIGNFSSTCSMQFQKLNSIRASSSFNDFTVLVNPFGKFAYEADGHVKVKPADPQTCNNPNRINASLKLEGLHDDSDSPALCVSDDALAVRQPAVNSRPIHCEAELPIKYALYLKPGVGQDVHVANMESDQIHIQSKNSMCFLKSIKAADIKLEVDRGEIVSQSVLQGNIDIRTSGSVPIKADKVQSLVLAVQQEECDVKIDSLYVKEAQIGVNKGNMKLGNCHGDIDIELEEGHISIGSLDGDLRANINKGSISLMVSQHNNIDVSLKQGDVMINVEDGLTSEFEIEAPSANVEFDKNLTKFVEEETDDHIKGHIGTSEPDDDLLGTKKKMIKIKADNGNVTLAVKDWLSSLKLR